ncbi:MAG TPA: hypothetical protein EYH32_01285 [Anaerolineae bacterium]|nr:hypothetical protein [Anaerolineae bacterium]
MTDAPWERQRDEQGNLEPARWFYRFDTFYRPLGPERSLLAAYNAWLAQRGVKRRNSVPRSWQRAAEKWRWKQRAEAWDAWQRQKRLEEEEEERRRWRKRRLELLHSFYDKVADALRGFNPTEATLSQLTQAVRVAAEQLRAEFDDLPTQRHQIGVRLEDVLDALPDGFREEVRRALAEALSEGRD